MTAFRNICAQEELFRRDHEDIMHTHALDYVRHRLPAPAPSVLRGVAHSETPDYVDLGTDEEEAEHEEEARRFGHVKVPMVTVVYDRRPGNHLDVQVRPHNHAPQTALSLPHAATQVNVCEALSA